MMRVTHLALLIVITGCHTVSIKNLDANEKLEVGFQSVTTSTSFWGFKKNDGTVSLSPCIGGGWKSVIMQERTSDVTKTALSNFGAGIVMILGSGLASLACADANDGCAIGLAGLVGATVTIFTTPVSHVSAFGHWAGVSWECVDAKQKT